MKQNCTIRSVAVALGAVLLTVCASANGELVQRDFLAAGDGLLTFDTDTGLEWLDLTQTVGWSYNQTLVSSLVVSNGFRFATEVDLRTLYEAAGIPTFAGQSSYSTANAAGVALLLSLVGCTTQCVVGAPAGQGWLDVGDPTTTYWAFYQRDFDGTNFNGGVTLAWGPRSKDSTYSDTGSFLVRVASLSIGERFESLLNDVAGAGSGKSLAKKVELAQTYYAVPDIQATCAVLTDFVGQVTNWSTSKRPKIETDDAAALITDAQAIMDAIGCG